MRDELDKLLCENYPKLFAERDMSPQETAMCWGFECGDGWFNILNTLCSEIQTHINFHDSMHKRLPDRFDTVEQVVVEQVKEKFGTLRFYYRGGDEFISGLVNMAEAMSAITCEICGKPGKLRGKSWYYTACDEHTKEGDLSE